MLQLCRARYPALQRKAVMQSRTADQAPGFGDRRQSAQIVAMIVADTFEAAREAAYKVHVSYNPETPSATFGSPGVTEEDASKASESAKDLPQAGDADAAYDAAEVKFEGEYGTPPHHHNPIELFATTAAWRDGELTIYEPSQFVYGLKNAVAQKLDIDPGRVHVVSPFVGGAFGSKAQLSPRTGLVAFAARKLNRPVKLVVTRDQGFTVTTYRAETQHRIRMGATREGKIKSFSHEGWEITSRPDPYAVASVEDSARLYGFGSVKTHVSLVHADRNNPASCAHRPSFLTFTRWKARWTSLRYCFIWTPSSCDASMTR
jgi:xanthine dehydrogenase YagR molybdenum-binding subunit